MNPGERLDSVCARRSSYKADSFDPDGIAFRLGKSEVVTSRQTLGLLDDEIVVIGVIEHRQRTGEVMGYRRSACSKGDEEKEEEDTITEV